MPILYSFSAFKSKSQKYAENTIAENAIPHYSHIAIYEVDPKRNYGADESEVAERMSERADTAYSPRFREEEHSAAAEQIMAYFPKCDYGADEITPCKTRGATLPR